MVEGVPGWVGSVSLIFIVLLAHGRCLGAQFFMDDFIHIVGNQRVLAGEWWMGGDLAYRRVAYFFFCGIYRVFGDSPVAFHAWTLLLHLASTLGVYAVGRRFLSVWKPAFPARQQDLAAWCGAAIFACHPLLTEGVNYAQNSRRDGRRSRPAWQQPRIEHGRG